MMEAEDDGDAVKVLGKKREAREKIAVTSVNDFNASNGCASQNLPLTNSISQA